MFVGIKEGRGRGALPSLGPHLGEVPLCRLVLEVQEEGSAAVGGVGVREAQQRRRRVPVGEHLQRCVADPQRVLHSALPVRVLVLQRREDLV